MTRLAGAPNAPDDAKVVANERLTALTGAVLLVLILVELVTSAYLRALMSAHIFVGVLLAAPLVIKLASTGYRFVRYYSGSIPFVRRGPPRLPLRVLAVPLVAITIVLFGSGFGLLLAGPAQPGPLLALHNVGTLIWLPMIVIHALAYLRRLPPVVTADLAWRPSSRSDGGRFRLGLNILAVFGGAAAAMLVLPMDAPWVVWARTVQQAPLRSSSARSSQHSRCSPSDRGVGRSALTVALDCSREDPPMSQLTSTTRCTAAGHRGRVLGSR